MINASRKARLRVVAPIAIAAIGLTAACSHRRPWHRPTTTKVIVAPPSTDGHGHTDEDHANMTTTTLGTSPSTDGHGHTDEDHANMTTTTVGPAMTTTTVGPAEHGDHDH
jgi:hypothetical protein